MAKTKPEPAAPVERRLIDKRVVAGLAGGVSTATVSRWAADDILPKPVKLGHLVRWWSDEVEAALAKLPRTDQPSAQPYILIERRAAARARARAKAKVEAQAKAETAAAMKAEAAKPAVGEKPKSRPKRKPPSAQPAALRRKPERSAVAEEGP